MLRAYRPQLEALEDRRLLSFSAPVNYAVGTDPQAVLTAYFNADSYLDIAVVNNDTNNVSVLLGNGNGTFQTKLNSATGTGPKSLAVGDFNGDNKLDLVTANSTSISVLLGKGDGTFQAPTNISIGSDPMSVAVGDFNGDGKLDIGVTSSIYVHDGCWYACYGHYEGNAHVLLGNGLGAFSDPNTTSLGVGYFTSAAAEDFNGDGKDDFATVMADGGTVSVLLGASNGVLGAPTSFNTGWYPLAVTVGDFTGDDILDLATAGSTVDILPGNGDGTFEGVVRTYYDPVALAAADFNGDTHLDLTTADPFTGAVSVLLGLGTGELTLPLDFTAGTSPTAVAAGDFNGDNRPDVVAANAGSKNVSVLLNDGVWPALNAPTIAIRDVTVTEGHDGTINAGFRITLSAAYNQTVTVKFATADGSATVADADYVAKTKTVTFLAGETSKTVNVVVNGDRVGEYDEYFYARLSKPTNAFIADATAVGNILNDEPRVSIDYGPVYVTEGNSGTTDAVFTIRLSAAYDAPVNVNFSTFEGDTEFLYSYWGTYGYYVAPAHATSNSDFQAVDDTITFAVGETVKTIPIVVNGDRNGEPDEYFSVNLTGASGAGIGAAHAVGIIGNDEPYLYINYSASVTEGDSGTTAMKFTVTLSAASDAPVTVAYATADNTATVAGGDYQAKSNTLTFQPGDTTKTFNVAVNGDNLAEYDESFYVRLSNATNASISNATATATIWDDEPRVSIDYGPTYVTEGNSGTTEAVFTVRLSQTPDAPVSVNFSTFEGDTDFASGNWYYGYYYAPPATSGVDFKADADTITFAVGETVKTIPIVINGDRDGEMNEAFSVNLDSPTGAVIQGGHAIGVIANDEPTVSIDNPTVVEGNSGTTALKFTVTLSAASGGTVTVSYATADGTATVADGDYQAKSNTLTFDPGQVSKTVTVQVNGDRNFEYDEYLYLNLTAATGAVLGYPWGYGNIQDDEPRLSISDVSVSEGNRGTKVLTFTVSLVAAYDQTVTVKYATHDDTAKAGEDYVATSGSLTFAAGQTSKTISVTIIGDKKRENNEYFYVQLSDASSNAVLWDEYGWGAILNDER